MSWLNRIAKAVVPKLPRPPSAAAKEASPSKPSGLAGFFHSTFEKATHDVLRVAFNGADKLIPNAVKTDALKGVEAGLDGVAKGTEVVFGKDSQVTKAVDQFSHIDLEAITRQQGLKADWLKLWGTWITEDRPKDLGTWDREQNGRDRVTISDPNSPYLQDLRGRPQQQDAIRKFLAAHNPPKAGDALTVPFSFNGPGTAVKGKYGPVEWFLGSYQTHITCTGVDPSTGKAQLHVEVTNESHFESATRVNAEAQKDLGLPKYLIGDRERGEGLGLGGNFDQRFIYDEAVDVPQRAVA